MSKSNLTNVSIPASSSNYTSGRRGYKICKFTPHHMAGNLSVEQCGRIFQNSGRNASSNYGIGTDGRIACYVEEENRAWTSSNGTNDCQSITVEVANDEIGGNWHVSDAAWNSLVKLAVDVCRRYNFRLSYDGTPNGSLTHHSMFAATSCPGPYLKSRMNDLVREVNAQLDGGNAPAPTPGKKSNDEIANEVIAGKWGNGSDRSSRLQAAGYDAGVIQSIVNQKLGASNTPAPKPERKSNETIAQEVINGAWGNGAERRDRIVAAGYDYNTIQNIVNQKLTGKTTSNKKSVDEIAREVIAGKWGNGADRKNKITAAGYNYSEVQKRVNALLR